MCPCLRLLLFPVPVPPTAVDVAVDAAYVEPLAVLARSCSCGLSAAETDMPLFRPYVPPVRALSSCANDPHAMSAPQEDVISNKRPLRILSVDGGGYRGLATLLILKRLMKALKNDPDDEDEVPPKPCEVFDLMVGTSTGGLIVLLLGRLGYSVEQAIELYLKLGKAIFGSPRTMSMLL